MPGHAVEQWGARRQPRPEAGKSLTDGIEIRPLEAGDRADWDRLWAAYLAFYGAERSRAQFDLTFGRYLDPGRGDMLAFVACSGGRCVGLAHVIVHSHGWQDAPVTYLQDLYVEEAARGTGAGRALIEAVFADADRSGRPNVYWMTQSGNVTARRLYDRIGVATDFMKYSRS